MATPDATRTKKTVEIQLKPTCAQHRWFEKTLNKAEKYETTCKDGAKSEEENQKLARRKKTQHAEWK